MKLRYDGFHTQIHEGETNLTHQNISLDIRPIPKAQAIFFGRQYTNHLLKKMR